MAPSAAIAPDGAPTETLNDLVYAATPDEFKATLRQIFTERYEFLFSDFDLTIRRSLDNAARLRRVRLDRQHRARKAIAFYLGAAQEAGIEVSSYLKVRKA